jgi:putative DNA primase/helicase
MTTSTTPTPLEVAQAYLARGWRVVPLPHASKKCLHKGWAQWRLTEDQLPDHFDGRPQNIGVLLGEPSGWLIDIDLDHHRAVELADEFLPPTPLVFGRPGKPRSHRLYRVSSPIASKKYNSKSAHMIVELRSTGLQTVFPPSTHESGEPICWEDESAEPAPVNADELFEAVKQLAHTVLVELGECPARAEKKRQQSKRPVSAEVPVDVPPDERSRRCLAAMLRMDMTDHKDGSSRLFAAACRVVEHDLDDTLGMEVLEQYARQKPFPISWTSAQILQRIRDAEKVCQRGVAVQQQLDSAGLVKLGTRDPATGRLVLSLKRTLPTAEAFVRDFYAHSQGRMLHSHAGLLLAWRHNRYAQVEDEAIKKRLHRWLHEALRYTYNRQTGEISLIDFESNPGTVKAALDTTKALVHLPATVTSPCWLRDSKSQPSALEILPCRSSLLHLPTKKHLEPTPNFFATTALDFDPDPFAPLPAEWLLFLCELFGDDIEAIDLLQEWFGYCLTGDTSLQKMLLMVGPRRSGKGTIARVLTRLVGSANVCGPTTHGLAGPFGLQPLLNKSLAIVSDARFSGDNVQTVIERLLCISGEDALTVDRKFLESVTLKLPLKFMFLSNELPRLSDSSAALAGRFLLLRLTKSFYGQEDPKLTDKLLTELPGILNWAIDGWHRLRERGHFQMPTSVEDAVHDMEDLASPVGAFVREECVVGAGHRVWVDDLYEAWRRWCEREGRTIISTRQSFGRDLAAAVPGLHSRRNQVHGRFFEGIGLRDASHVPAVHDEFSTA